MKKKHAPVKLSTLTVLSVAIATLVAVAVSITVFSSVYSRAGRRDAQVNSEQAVRQTAVAIDNQIDAMKARLSKFMKLATESHSADDFLSQIKALTELEENIYAIIVYDDNGNIVSCAGSGFEKKENVLRDLSFDRELFEGADTFALSKPHVETLFEGAYPWVVTLAAKSEAPILGTGRYVVIDFRFSEIADYIDKVGIGRHGYCYIIDTEGNIVYHPQQQMIFSGIKEEDSFHMASLENGVHTEKGRICALTEAANGAWRIVGVSYTEDLDVELRTQIALIILISLCGCAAVLLIVWLVYSRIVNAPVRALIRAMRDFENAADSYVYSPPEESVRELQVLSDSFSQMADRIRQLMERVRREETELRKTELRALQAQINPHFLYNTLDSIQWMCEAGNTEDAAKMVGALARLFRISISRGHELIPIRDEIRHAESYLLIQSYRYRNQFTYVFEVDPELEGYLCNKITIQPLIENAIYHGIDRMVDEGEIRITVRTAPDAENDILITVADNGVGMTREQCGNILRKDRSDSGGIGVKNVNDRLRIYFGEKYGLSIESEPDVGTTVTVRMPKIEREEDISRQTP